MTIFGIFFSLVRIVLILLVTLAGYALSALALYNIAKNNNVPNPWLAFVPVVHYCIVGSICEEYRIWGVTIRGLKVVLPILVIVQAAASASFFLLLPALIAIAVIVLVMHKFFYLFEPRRAFVLAALCLFGRLGTGIALYCVKDMRMQMSAGAYNYPFGERGN